jgi:hypothetical protein
MKPIALLAATALLACVISACGENTQPRTGTGTTTEQQNQSTDANSDMNKSNP